MEEGVVVAVKVVVVEGVPVSVEVPVEVCEAL